MHPLDRKLVRDLVRLRGQAIAWRHNGHKPRVQLLQHRYMQTSEES
ncbi:MAG: hypothetical protein AB4050_02720 [Synechococcus sp.]